MPIAMDPASHIDAPYDDRAMGLRGHLSWGAIVAGVAIALTTQLLLNLLGVGVGAALLDIGPGADNSGSGFSAGAGIWWVSAGIVAAAAGGITAGRLAGAGRVATARWHGLVTWAATTLIVVYLLSSAVGGIMGGAFSALGSVANGAGHAAAATASGVAGTADGDMLGKQARRLIDPNGAQTVQESLASYLKASVSGDRQAAAAAKAQAVNGLAQTAHIPPAEAQARIDQAGAAAQRSYQTAKVKAEDAAEATRTGVAIASILGFVALVLGAVTSWFAGATGARLRERLRADPARGRIDR